MKAALPSGRRPAWFPAGEEDPEVMSYFRENIESMKAYVPGEQPAAGAKVIKLNTNENPLPPSPAAMEALRAFDGGRLRAYPDPMAGEFCRAAAEVLDVPVDWVLPGNGSDDLIMMVARAAAGPRRRIVYPVPTFEFYFTQARIEAAERVEVPLAEDFRLDVGAMAAAKGAVTFVASPNSPTGLSVGNGELDDLAGRLEGLLVVDEAYVDFADAHALTLVRKHGNLIILRTLSKGYSLAGLRLGFAVAQPALLRQLAKTKQIYNVGVLACTVGAAAIRDQRYRDSCVEKVRALRAELTRDLEGLGCAVLPSQSNFLLVRPPGNDAEGVYRALKDRGILVRYYRSPRLEDRFRVTVGTERQNAAIVAALRELLKPKP
jgi:histidinol-phosphate aminotransferase